MDEAQRIDEAQLIARSQQGDVGAFNQLVLFYQQAVYAFVLRLLRHPETAADITQDTFLAAFRGIHSFRTGSSLRAWLMRIASNQACDHWRRINRHAQESLDELLDEDEPHGGGQLSSLVASGAEVNPEEHLLTLELQSTLQDGLRNLPLDQQVAVILCDIQGLSYDEIAVATQSTMGTVRSRIARGRMRLRKYLIQHRELLPRSYRLSVEQVDREKS